MSEVEARREARRRKILENPEARLQRITGVEKRNASKELEGYKSLNIENGNSIEDHVHNSSLLATDFPSDNHHSSSSQLENHYRSPVLSSSFLNNASVEQLTFTKTYKIPIIIGIACLLNILQLFFQDQDPLLLNNIFIPLLCFEAVYLFCNQNDKTNYEITNILRLFCTNIPPHRLSLLIKYFTLFITITRDVMIYFFSFVCIWFVFKVLRDILFF